MQLSRVLSKLTASSAVAVCALALAACSTPSRSAATHSAKSVSSSASSLSKSAKYHGPVRVHQPPAEVCPKSPVVPQAPAAAAWDATNAPVTVKTAADGWSLQAAGAPLGAVAAELARATGKPLWAGGQGANVPIWARLENQEIEAIVERLASATGTEAVEDGVGYLFVHPQQAVEMRRADRAMRMQLAPIEMRIIEAEQPAQVAPLLAWAALGCRGDLTSVPSRGWLIARETRQQMEDFDKLLDWATSEEDAKLDGKFALDRRITFGVADAHASTCQPVVPPDDVGGRPVGEVVVSSVTGDVVVGCGGDRRIHAPDKLTLTGNTLRALGVQKLEANVYASPEVRRDHPAKTRAKTLQLHAFESTNPSEIAQIVRTQFTEVHTFVYQPRSALLVAADKDLMPQVASLIDEYEEAAE